MNIVVVDYGIGNIQSIQNALNKFGIKAVLTSDRDVILKSDGVILPGVGAFKKGMIELRSRGLDVTINQYVKTSKPLLGVCLGMQLLFDTSEEFGSSNGLGIIKGSVCKLPIFDDEKLPNISWNPLIKSEISWNNTILDNVTIDEQMYFIHSYVCNPLDKSIVLANAKYGNISFCASLKYNNIYGCQFHPEKSSTAGLKVIENFINIINQEQI